MKRILAITLAACTLLSCIMLHGCAFGSFFNKELSAEEIYELVAPSVVEITGEMRNGTTIGTGFFYDDKGTIITNYHVIEDCVSATITLSTGISYDVDRVLGYSAEKDLAILSTTCTSSVPLTIRTTPLKTGESVYTIGSSLGLSGSLSNGIISSTERIVENQIYIQTTAPISQGNSGGPLLDTEGNVIGIVTASFVAGQNLNLAIPVSEIASISTSKPTTLRKLFPEKVEWISERDFFYYEDRDTFVLAFALLDEDKVTIGASGTALIEIVNDDGVSVYKETRTFTEANFQEWIYEGSVNKFLTSIYIDPDDITPGITATGTVYFTVYGDYYIFKESTLAAKNLPTIPIQVELSDLPQKVHFCASSGRIYCTTLVENIDYKVINGTDLYIYFTGKKTYDYEGAYATNPCKFKWNLYDYEGHLINSGTVYVSDLISGEKFQNTPVIAWDHITPGASYKITITNY